MYPPQWVQCDLRYFDTSILGKYYIGVTKEGVTLIKRCKLIVCLGKFAIVMADPPWDIHVELPYGTLSDDEMRQLGVFNLQDEGLLLLWVTGRLVFKFFISEVCRDLIIISNF